MPNEPLAKTSETVRAELAKFWDDPETYEPLFNCIGVQDAFAFGKSRGWLECLEWLANGTDPSQIYDLIQSRKRLMLEAQGLNPDSPA